MTIVPASTQRRPLSGRGRPRTPGVIYAAAASIMVVLVGTFALTARQAAPPTIAEFAPQAVEQIRDRSEAAAGSESGGSGESLTVDQQAGSNDAAHQAVDVARVRRCVGDPPRQIEDPQSPPCLPYWSGDNGGATARGVTRDEIRVTSPIHNADLVSMEAFFNSRFEFYGRRIRLIPRGVGGGPAPERASAKEAYEQDKAFASLMSAGESQHYLDELARLGIIGVHFHPMFPETHLAARRPYLWTYPMANDRSFALMGEWYCARFAGRNAVHAGDPLIQAARRTAGIILYKAGWEGTSLHPLNDRLASCGERSDAVVEGTVEETFSPVFWENAMLQMKTSGVTTLACLCETLRGMGLGMRAATNQGYFPEWLVTSYVSNDRMVWVRALGTPEQQRALMLLLPSPMQRPYADHPSNWAVQETTQAGYPATALDQDERDLRYRSLLLLASGFQMAGPHLTPATFERGLQQARFPNPVHQIKAGAVGFTDGDHSMTEDAAEVWWSNEAASPYGEGAGTFCYVDHGDRRHIGTFPGDDPFFRGPCDNGT